MFNGLSVCVRSYALPSTDYPLIAASGFKWIRTNLPWSGVEYRLGQYDFTAFDQLVANAQANGLRVHFILEGGNALYTGSNTTLPTTAAGVQGFANFAAERVRGTSRCCPRTSTQYAGGR